MIWGLKFYSYLKYILLNLYTLGLSRFLALRKPLNKILFLQPLVCSGIITHLEVHYWEMFLFDWTMMLCYILVLGFLIHLSFFNIYHGFNVKTMIIVVLKKRKKNKNFSI